MSADENRTPLDAEEQALARRYRALPDGEPPPALDARIRAQARSAAQAGRPKLRPWAWGLSTAAAAVLALAMLWQTGLPPTTEDAAYRTLPGAAPKAVEPLLHEQAGTAREERAQQDATTPAADVAAPAPAPASAPPAAQSTAPAPATLPERGSANRKAFAPPAAETSAAARRSTAAEAQPEAPAAASAELQAPRPPAAATADAPPATTDGLRGDPDAWLRHIAQRLADGHREEARRELRDFRAAWPGHALPPSLQALLDDDAR